jgi:hypothetical protein
MYCGALNLVPIPIPNLSQENPPVFKLDGVSPELFTTVLINGYDARENGHPGRDHLCHSGFPPARE